MDILKEVLDFAASPSGLLSFVSAIIGAFLWVSLKISSLKWSVVIQLIHTKCRWSIDISGQKYDRKDGIIVAPAYILQNHIYHNHQANERLWNAIESSLAWKAAFWLGEHDDLLFIITLFFGIVCYLFKLNLAYLGVLPITYFLVVGLGKLKARRVGTDLVTMATTVVNDQETFYSSNGYNSVTLN